MLTNVNEDDAQTFRGFYSRDFDPDPTLPDLNRYFPKLIVSYHLPEPSAITLATIAACVLVPLWQVKRRRATEKLNPQVASGHFAVKCKVRPERRTLAVGARFAAIVTASVACCGRGWADVGPVVISAKTAHDYLGRAQSPKGKWSK